MDKPAESYFSQIRLPAIGPHFVGRFWWAGYVLALLLAAAVALGRYALKPLLGVEAPLLPFVLVVSAAGYLGGRGPALFAVAVSVAAAHALFGASNGQDHEGIAWIGHLTLFIIICALLSEGIHRLQLAEKALRDSERRLRAILDRASAVVFFKDREGRYLFVNDEFLRIFGYERDQVLGRTEGELFNLEISTEMREHDMKVWDSGTPFTAEESVPQTDGLHTYVATKFLLRDREGQPYALCGIATDITDQKHIEEALRRADRRKDIFLATLSHELRNPLAPIRHAAVLLRTPDISPHAARQARDIIERQSLHLSRLLDDLLDVARITRGSLELRKSVINIRSVVETALESARPLMENRRHTMTVELAREPLMVDGDSVRLSQVVANLLTNAAKYTEPGGRVRIRTYREEREVCVSVLDNGIGIPADSLPRIFEMFSQGKSEMQHAEGGLGIGLALVRGLLELHDGAVEARSAGSGEGSEFIIRIPECVEIPSGITLDPVVAETLVASHGCRVLIADDNRDAADSLEILLQGEGHRIEKAYDGLAALAAAHSFRPEFALLDIGMPGLTGYEVAQQIRSQPWGAEVTLIAITGWGQAQDKQRALAAGFDHHITKPVEPERLQALLALERKTVH